MFAAMGLQNYEIWMNVTGDKQTCSKCRKILPLKQTHMHPVSQTKAIKAFKRNQGELKK